MQIYQFLAIQRAGQAKNAVCKSIGSIRCNRGTRRSRACGYSAGAEGVISMNYDDFLHSKIEVAPVSWIHLLEAAT